MIVHPRTPRARLLAAALLALLSGRAGAAPTPEELRVEFRQALEAAARPGAAAVADSAPMRGYVLYPYLEAARLRTALAALPAGEGAPELDARIRDLLAREGASPSVRELRREWVAALAARQAWKDLLANAPAEGADVATQCHGWAARLALGDTALPREAVLAIWIDTRAPPRACDPALRWIEAGASPAELERRAIAAAKMRVKLPALDRLPPARRALVQAWDRLMADPERGLKQLVVGPKAGGEDADHGEAIVEAFDRLARRDSRRSRPLYPGLRNLPQPTPAQRERLLRAHALGLAYDFVPESVAAFQGLPEAATDTVAHEWRLRAALLHGDHAQAARWIDALPAAQAQEPRWRYWRARLLDLRGDPGTKAAYAAVATEREYYGFLAAERAGLPVDLRPQALAEDGKLVERLRALPGLRRAEELFRCGLNDLAAAEFRAALATEPAAAKAQAARLASLWGWHETAVRVVSELQLWDDVALRYPLPWDAEVSRAAGTTGLAPEWIHAVMRTESLYNPRAVSNAGALGLLQLILPTARLTARRHGWPRPDQAALFDPGTNIALGARHLAELQERFDGRLIFTLAAYNAGPLRVPQWAPPRTVDADVWIENIPYNETRQYVQRNLSGTVILGWRRGGVPGKLLPLLAPVPPDSASAVAAVP